MSARPRGRVTGEPLGYASHRRVDRQPLLPAASISGAGIDGTNGDDTIDVSGDAEVVKVDGLVATQIRHPEVVSDRLEINTLAGTDTVDSAGLASEAIQLFVDSVLVP